MNRLKVLYVSNEAGVGGAMQSMLDMIVGLREYVSPVVIIPSAGVAESLLKERKIIYYIVSFALTHGAIGRHTQVAADDIFVNNYQAAMKIVDIAETEGVQLIHTNSVVVNVGAMAALIKGIPHIWHVREFLEEDFSTELYDRDWTCKLFEQSGGFISISDCIRKSYNEKYSLLSTQIYDGFDTNRYKRDLTESANGSYTFLLAGCMDSGKGQWDAVRAMELLVQSGEKRPRLIMVGEGQRKYVWSLQHYIREKSLQEYIFILPAQKDLSTLRACCGFSLTTSKMEALGRVTIEAMLAGHIIIGANTGGTAEIIGGEGERGYLYQQGNPSDLAFVMKRAMSTSAETAFEMRKKAQEFALSFFDFKEYAKKVLEQYEGVLSKRKRISKELVQYMDSRYKQLSGNSGNKPDIKPGTGNGWQKQTLLFERWLRLRQKGYSLDTYCKENHMMRVAIYGMGYLGCCVYDELENGGITISYAIDKNSSYLEDSLKVVRPDDDLESVDAIIITVAKEEAVLETYLEKRCSYKIVRLSEMIGWMEREVVLAQLKGNRFIMGELKNGAEY